MTIRKRSIMKAITWEGSGFVLLTGLTYFLTGELLTSSLLSLAWVGTRIVMYYFHDLMWKRIGWLKPKKADQNV